MRSLSRFGTYSKFGTYGFMCAMLMTQLGTERVTEKKKSKLKEHSRTVSLKAKKA